MRYRTRKNMKFQFDEETAGSSITATMRAASSADGSTTWKIKIRCSTEQRTSCISSCFFSYSIIIKQ